MKLELKMSLIILFTTAIIIFIFYFISYQFLLNNFIEMEHQEVEKNLENVLNILTNEIESIEFIARDWAIWDETYDYVGGKNENYEENYLNFDSLSTIDIDDILYLNNEGKILYGMESNFEEGILEEMSFEDISTFSSLVGENITIPSGFLTHNNHLVAFSVQPIYPGEEGGQTSNGYLIMARHLDDAHLEKLREISQLDFKINILAKDIPSELEELISLSGNEYLFDYSLSGNVVYFESVPYFKKRDIFQLDKTYVVPINKTTVGGFAFIEDISGKPIVFVELYMGRQIILRGKQTLNYLLLMVVLFVFILWGLIFYLVKRFFLKRILDLIYKLKNVNKNGKISLLSEDNLGDEISDLYVSINSVLKEIDDSHKAFEKVSFDLKKEKEELKNKIFDLEKFEKLVVDRELKMMELKGKLEKEGKGKSG